MKGDIRRRREDRRRQPAHSLCRLALHQQELNYSDNWTTRKLEAPHLLLVKLLALLLIVNCHVFPLILFIKSSSSNQDHQALSDPPLKFDFRKYYFSFFTKLSSPPGGLITATAAATDNWKKTLFLSSSSWARDFFQLLFTQFLRFLIPRITL